jgi:hypothetical protein
MRYKTIALSILLIIIFISCKKEELSVTMNTETMMLKGVYIENEPYYLYTYNDSSLIVEESGKLDYTLHKYNTKNQIESSDYYWNSSILSTDIKTITTTLSQSSFVTSSSGSKGATIKYEYDQNNLLTKVTYTRATSTNSEYSQFTYDDNNRIESQILYWNGTETGHIDYFYDSRGNMIKEQLYGMSSTGADELSTTVVYSFDNKRNPYKALKSLMIPGIYTNTNNITKEVYTVHLDGTDKVQVISNSYEYNSNGYPTNKNNNTTFLYE